MEKVLHYGLTRFFMAIAIVVTTSLSTSAQRFETSTSISSSKSVSSTNNSSSSSLGSTDGRCAAITKKGTRCSRKAAAGSIYCWQHSKYNSEANNTSTSLSKSVSTTNKSSYNSFRSTGGQCAARTKKGTRCSRKAAAGSIYCWQHNK